MAELLRLEEGDGPSYFRLVGELDVSNASDITERLQAELRRTGRLTLDTGGVTFMDSQGLRLLILLGMEASEREATVTLVNCSPQVRRLLDVSVPQGIPGVEIVEADG